MFQIVEWVNKSSDGSANAQQKCEAITQIQEVLLHSDSDLLDEFIDNVLSFSHDASQDVRRSVVGFIEEVRYVNMKMTKEFKAWCPDSSSVIL